MAIKTGKKMKKSVKIIIICAALAVVIGGLLIGLRTFLHKDS